MLAAASTLACFACSSRPWVSACSAAFSAATRRASSSSASLASRILISWSTRRFSSSGRSSSRPSGPEALVLGRILTLHLRQHRSLAVEQAAMRRRRGRWASVRVLAVDLRLGPGIEVGLADWCLPVCLLVSDTWSRAGPAGAPSAGPGRTDSRRSAHVVRSGKMRNPERVRWRSHFRGTNDSWTLIESGVIIDQKRRGSQMAPLGGSRAGWLGRRLCDFAVRRC